jgi:hypothetical protein
MWIAVQTITGRELVAGKSLEELGARVFLPLAQPRRMHRRGSPWVERAYFPGYLFAEVSAWLREHRMAAGVIDAVKAGHEPLEIPVKIIEELRGRCDDRGVMLSPPPWLRAGGQARIGARTPLAGLQLILDAVGGRFVSGSAGGFRVKLKAADLVEA